MVVNSNTIAERTVDYLSVNADKLSKSLFRLSSGSKIVKPSDDSAGLAISSRIETKLKKINSSLSNLGKAISFTQTQDGYLKTANKALTRMSELTILAQDITKSAKDLELYDNEFQQLKEFFIQLENKEFDSVRLFSDNSINLTIDSSGTEFTIPAINLLPDGNPFEEELDIKTSEKAKAALDSLKEEISNIAKHRGTIGAIQSRINFTNSQVTLTQENLTEAKSRITDVNVAKASTDYARFQILVQSGTSMLSQANAMPKTVLQLLS